MFNWLRNKIRNSILAGASDALKELAGEAPDEAPAVAVLRLTLAAPDPAGKAPEPERARARAR